LYVDDEMVDSIGVSDARAACSPKARSTAASCPSSAPPQLAAGERHHGNHRADGGRRVTQVATWHKLLPTYARLDVTFTDGDGSWLVDADGKRYLDLFAGIAVVGLGHRHPAAARRGPAHSSTGCGTSRTSTGPSR